MKKEPVCDRAAGPVPGDGDDIRCYDNAIPDFVAAEMDRCYSSLYSSVSYLRLTGKLSGSTSTYVARSGSAIRAVFLFEREGSVVRVLNGSIRTGQEEVGRFADYLFGSMPGIDEICFPGVHMGKLQAAYPCQRFFAGEDIVVSFTGTAEEYARRIGKSTRKSLRRHIADLELQHPGWCYQVMKGNAIDAPLIDLIAHWNRQRLSGKHKVSAYKDEDVQQVTALAANDGMIGTVMTENRMRAGTVCCHVGCSLYMMMTGYDSAYNEFSLGMLCNYWTAMESIRMQCKEINLMGGRLPYKYSLLGESRKYDSLVIYRNRVAFFRHFRDVVRTALHGYALEAKFAILDCERKEGRVARLVARAIGAWRASKQACLEIGHKAS
jgi:hypothetical protein